MGIIYLVKNLKNGKCYVGQTKTSLQTRWKRHISDALHNRRYKTYFANAINYHGSSSFEVTVLESDVTDEDIDLRETFYITSLQTFAPHGYNLQLGGQAHGRVPTAISKEKMRNSKLGEKNHNFGKPRDPETRQNISEAKQKERHHFYGKSFTTEHRINLSKSHRVSMLPMYLIQVKPRPHLYQSGGYAVINHPNGKNKYFTSKKLTDEHKLQLAREYLASLSIQL
jgi:group I intron endonuclease